MSNTFKGFAAGIIAAIFYGTNPLGTLFLYQDEINPTSVLVLSLIHISEPTRPY